MSTAHKVIDFANGSHPFSVIVIPTLQDNYSYLILDKSTHLAAVVDPVELSKIIPLLGSCNLTTILTTHHHSDHAGGNLEIQRARPSINTVIGFDERVPGVTKCVQHGDHVAVGNLIVHCIYTPCHTTGSISFFIDGGESSKAVFTGDTLFLAGCGKFFEGGASEMVTALYDRIGALPDDTHIFPGHEYTLANLKFAQSVDPENEHIQKAIAELTDQLDKNGCICSVPGQLSTEWKINPFMRLSTLPIMQATNSLDSNDKITIMARLRDMKNRF